MTDYTQSRVFEEGDFVTGRFGHDGYAFNIDGPPHRQYMSIHLLDDVDHFTRVVHSSAYEVELVRDVEVAAAEREAEQCRRAIKNCDDHIRGLQARRAEAKRDLAEAQKRRREARKIPTKVDRPTRTNADASALAENEENR
jgi:hypothetical protein